MYLYGIWDSAGFGVGMSWILLWSQQPGWCYSLAFIGSSSSFWQCIPIQGTGYDEHFLFCMIFEQNLGTWILEASPEDIHQITIIYKSTQSYDPRKGWIDFFGVPSSTLLAPNWAGEAGLSPQAVGTLCEASRLEMRELGTFGTKSSTLFLSTIDAVGM